MGAIAYQLGATTSFDEPVLDFSALNLLLAEFGGAAGDPYGKD